MHLDPAAFGPVYQDSNIPSEIVRYKLFAAGGAVTIPLLDGKPCQIIANPEGKTFVSDKLSQKTFSMEYTVFDTIVQLLLSSKNILHLKATVMAKRTRWVMANAPKIQ